MEPILILPGLQETTGEVSVRPIPSRKDTPRLTYPSITSGSMGAAPRHHDSQISPSLHETRANDLLSAVFEEKIFQFRNFDLSDDDLFVNL